MRTHRLFVECTGTENMLYRSSIYATPGEQGALLNV